jgi:hypothetical protein
MSENRLRLKQARGWFAASEGFRAALELLSDGAFRMFVHLCLEADRRSGRILTSYSELAREISRSRRVVVSYVSELDRKGVCVVRAGRNQHTRTLIEVADSYWPYFKQTRGDDVAQPDPAKQLLSRASGPQAPPTGDESNKYLEAVRRWYLDAECTVNRFSLRDRAKALEFHSRGLPLELIDAALLLGTARKYVSWLNGGARVPIGSLEYFEPLVAEVQDQPPSETYRKYLRARTGQLAALCKASGIAAGGSPVNRNLLAPNIPGAV